MTEHDWAKSSTDIRDYILGAFCLPSYYLTGRSHLIPDIEKGFMNALRVNCNDPTDCLVYADWMEEQGRVIEAAAMRQQAKCPPQEALQHHDWAEAFAFAGEIVQDRGGYGGPRVDEAKPGSGVHTTLFSRTSVATIVAMQDGKRDVKEWICAGRLWDGRYFLVKAGCCYSWWDVLSGGSACVANTLDEIIYFGMNALDRVRLDMPRAC